MYIKLTSAKSGKTMTFNAFTGITTYFASDKGGSEVETSRLTYFVKETPEEIDELIKSLE